MRAIGKIKPAETDFLPGICRVRGCFRDAKKPELLCKEHAALARLRALGVTHQKKIKAGPHCAVKVARGLAPTQIYAIRASDGRVKFGAAGAPRARLRTLATGNALELTLVASMLVGTIGQALALEGVVKRYLKADCVRREWFRWTPRAIAIVNLIRAKDLSGLLEFLNDSQLIAKICPPEIVRKADPVSIRPVDI